MKHTSPENYALLTNLAKLNAWLDAFKSFPNERNFENLESAYNYLDMSDPDALDSIGDLGKEAIKEAAAIINRYYADEE